MVERPVVKAADNARRRRSHDLELPPPTDSLWPAFVLFAVIAAATVMVLWGAR